MAIELKTYKDKLKNPLWQKRRLQIFEKDKWRCKQCGNHESELQVHHVDYIPGINPWEYPDDMLITLCHICHNKETGREKLEYNLATTFKMKGFLYSDLLALSSKIDTDQKFTISLLKILRNG